MSVNIAQWLWAAAKDRPEAPALFTGQTCVASYSEFAARAASVARKLAGKGVAPGDRVGLFMSNSVEYLCLLYGIWWCGAVAVPINYKLHAKEAEHILQNSEARLVFCDRKTLSEPLGITALDGIIIANEASDRGPDQPVACSSDDLAWLFYTSGTTGNPKGVMLTHRSLQQMSICYTTDVDPVASEDAALYAAPMSHGAGLYNMIHVRQGARHIVPESKGFDPDEILDLAKMLGPISFFAAPTMVRRLVVAAQTRGETGAGIKTVVYGGGPMYRADVEQAIETLGQRFVQIYGQGESPMTITCLNRAAHSDTHRDRLNARLGSVGRAHSIAEVRITGENGAVLGPGDVGEIEVKSPTVMLGYWKNPDATEKCLTDGWLRTGDMGRLDEDGYLTLIDRSKDLIISGGSNIHPREVEEVLLTHSSVDEVSVVGLPDEEWGEIVIACVVIAPGKELNQKELDELCLASIARFKRPKRYVQYTSLPKNAYGKVLRRELRTQLLEE